MKQKYFTKGIAVMAVCSLAFGAFGVTGQAQEGAGLGVVDTAYGQAQGVPGALDGITLFKGVPYAAPPVGELRWAEPQDPEAWDGVRVFDTYAPMAMQWPNDMAGEPWKTDFYYEGLPLPECGNIRNKRRRKDAGLRMVPRRRIESWIFL